MVRDCIHSTISPCRPSLKGPVSSQPLALWSNGIIKSRTSSQSLFGTSLSLMCSIPLAVLKKQHSTGVEAICSTSEQQSHYIPTFWRVQGTEPREAWRQKLQKLLTKILRNGEPVLCSPDHQIQPLSPRKPLPLTTVELQKAGSRLLKMAPKKVLDVSCVACVKVNLLHSHSSKDCRKVVPAGLFILPSYWNGSIRLAIRLHGPYS